VDTLVRRKDWSEDEFIEIGTRYFHQGVACPFLEEESCSIHLDGRSPVANIWSRSPAANCACPRKDNIDKVPLPVQVWTALARFDQTDPNAKYCRWVPLVLAPEWADSHLDEPPLRPGPELLRELFQRMTSQYVPDAPVQPASSLPQAGPTNDQPVAPS